MGMIAINDLYMAKMPNSCKECPLTYLDTGDDAYFGANERRCVIDDSCVDGMVSERSYDCPLVKTYTKADMVAMLTDIQLEIEELDLKDSVPDYQKGADETREYIADLLQQKIDALKDN